MYLTSDGDLHKLLNYQGRRFDIKDVMGCFEKDDHAKIKLQKSNKGFVDLVGRRVSEKGYLVDAAMNIIDTQGRVIFNKCDLKNGEFPKIFPYTKFNIRNVMGDFDMNASGNPVLSKGKHGGFVDRQKRVVNQRGYFIDKEGNVIDYHGNPVFDKIILGKDGEIPPVFRTGLLKEETISNMSDLMNEIEKNTPMDNKPKRATHDEGETSMDSKMEDTPANYNVANQRFDGNNTKDQTATQDMVDEEDDDEYGAHMAPDDDDFNQGQNRKRKGKKKKKVTTVSVLPPTAREKNMAGAYGG